MQVVLRQAIASVQERQLDDEAAADDDATEMLDELLGDRFHRPPGREDVVVDQHAGATRDHLRMELEGVLPVLEGIARADRLRRELAGAPGRNEAATDLFRDRSAEDETARFGAEHEVR